MLANDPNNEMIKSKIEYIKKFNKNNPSIDAMNKRYSGCYGIGKHR
jgi:hypothetical protein